MGIQKSNLNNEKIREILKTEYGMEAHKVEEIDRGTANIFKIIADQGTYVLKECAPKRTEDYVKKEIDIINFLKTKAISVPSYAKTINGRYYTANEGRVIVVQEFVEGHIAKCNTGNYAEVMESATLLGQITKALKDYPTLSDNGVLKKHFSKLGLQNKIVQMEELKKNLNDDNPYKEKIENELDFRIKISKEIEENFDFEIIPKLTTINSHGDYSVMQFIYNAEGVTVLDFEKARKMPIVWEIIRSYSYIDKDAVNGEMNIDTLVAYFKEFCKYVALTKYDLKYAAQVYLLQLAGSNYGYKEYNEDYSQTNLPGNGDGSHFPFLCKVLISR